MSTKSTPETVGEGADVSRMLSGRGRKAAETRRRRLGAQKTALTNAERQAAFKVRQTARYQGALRALSAAIAELPARKRAALLESLAPDLRGDLDHAMQRGRRRWLS